MLNNPVPPPKKYWFYLISVFIYDLISNFFLCNQTIIKEFKSQYLFIFYRNLCMFTLRIFYFQIFIGKESKTVLQKGSDILQILDSCLFPRSVMSLFPSVLFCLLVWRDVVQFLSCDIANSYSVLRTSINSSFTLCKPKQQRNE